jgi:hypothetical protein
MLKLDLERQRVRANVVAVVVIEIIHEHLMVVSGAVNVVIVVAKVSDILAASLPANVVVGGVCRRVHQRPHTLFVQTIGFCQIDDGESVSKETRQKHCPG